MALIVAVTAISVTAAWFSNFASSGESGFTIDSDYLQEKAVIKIDETISGYGVSVWPAIANVGVLEKGGEAPFGQTLKSKSDTINSAAKTATLYFPINFVGSPDISSTTEDGETNAIDGRKTLLLSVSSVHIKDAGYKYSELDFKGDFNVELALVDIIDSSPQPIANITPPFKDSTSVYYVQPTLENGEPGYDFYMLVIPGETYYVQATIYFNKIDEECNPDLLRADSVEFTFDIKNDQNDLLGVDVRNGVFA